MKRAVASAVTNSVAGNGGILLGRSHTVRQNTVQEGNPGSFEFTSDERSVPDEALPRYDGRCLWMFIFRE